MHVYCATSPPVPGNAPAALRLAHDIAKAFEGATCKPNRLRPLANEWVSWAGSCVLSLASMWFRPEEQPAHATRAATPRAATARADAPHLDGDPDSDDAAELHSVSTCGS